MTTVEGPAENTAPGRRQRKAARTRAEIEAAALRLFTAQGFDATTVEQIAESADIAPRTFFRYFPTKEDVLFGDLHGEFELTRAVLQSRPDDEHPMRSLTIAMLDAAERVEADREQHLMRAELLDSLDATGDYELQVLRQRWSRQITELAAERLAVPVGSDPRPGAYAMAMVSCFGAAMHAWLLCTDGTPLRSIFADLLTGLADGTAQAATASRE